VTVGYLASEYPKVSHTFIDREIAALRRLGVPVQTFTVRRTPEERLYSDADRAAAGETVAILPTSAGRLLAAHARALLRHPGRYAQTLARALRLSSGGVRAGLWQLFYFAEAMILRDECRRRGVTHLHAHFANVASAVTMLAAEYDDGLTWSFTMHGPTEFDDVTRFALGEKIRSARFVACISDYCRAQMMRLVDPEHWERLELIRCGLDTGQLPAAAPAPRNDDGPLRVMTVGRLVPDKGQALLLRAVAELRDRGVPARLTIVGDGPERRTLERTARRLGVADRVEFAGALGQAEVAERLQRADVFCLPSFAEGLPVVLMEAMAQSLPVIATRIAAVGELVEDGVSGLVVSPSRVDELATAIARLQADPEQRARMGEAGRARVLRDYDVNASAAILARLFTGGAAIPAERPVAASAALPPELETVA
jgi:colanic acid/amylovoran biosynthesis glycosyltransferase